MKKFMSKKKKIPLNAYLSYAGEKSSLIIGIYFSCFLIFAVFTGKLIIFPAFAEDFYVLFSYDVDSKTFIKYTLLLSFVCIGCFVDTWLFRREKNNTIKFDVYGVPRKKRPYNEMWRLKIVGVFLLIVFTMYLFLGL